MSKLLDLFAQVKQWPRERQEDAERLLEAMMIEGGIETYVLSQRERELIDEGLGSRIVSPVELESFRRRRRA